MVKYMTFNHYNMGSTPIGLIIQLAPKLLVL